MTLGPFERAVPWIEENLIGTRRFLERLWRYAVKCIGAAGAASSPEIAYQLNHAVQKVTSDIETFKFNTAVTALNILLNECEGEAMSRKHLAVLLRITAPFAPHITEELWSAAGHPGSIHHAPWPEADQQALVKSTVTLPVQVNGKRRAEIVVAADASEAQIRQAIEAEPSLRKWIGHAEIKRLIVVPGRIVNVTI